MTECCTAEDAWVVCGAEGQLSTVGVGGRGEEGRQGRLEERNPEQRCGTLVGRNPIRKSTGDGRGLLDKET